MKICYMQAEQQSDDKALPKSAPNCPLLMPRVSLWLSESDAVPA